MQRSSPRSGPRARRPLRRERQAHHVAEVGGRLGVGEPEVGGPDLQQVTPRPPARQRQRWIGSTGDHQADMGRRVFHQERQRLVDLGCLDRVVVVEHEGHVAVDGFQFGHHRGHDGLQRQARAQRVVRLRAEIGHCRPERRQQIPGEDHRVVVAGVERHPTGTRRSGRLGRPEPLGQQRRLPEAGGGRHQGEDRVMCLCRSLGETLARHHRPAEPWRVQLGGEELAGTPDRWCRAHRRPVCHRWVRGRPGRVSTSTSP